MHWLSHIEGDRCAAAWHLALSGLRRGEIAALRWSDIDLNSGTIAVSRNRLRFGDKVVEGTVKSKASDRKLPLGNAARFGHGGKFICRPLLVKWLGKMRFLAGPGHHVVGTALL